MFVFSQGALKYHITFICRKNKSITFFILSMSRIRYRWNENDVDGHILVQYYRISIPYLWLAGVEELQFVGKATRKSKILH